MISIDDVYKERANTSTTRLSELRSRLQDISAVSGYPELTIFSAGSYARHEASTYSDIDMFFLCSKKREDTHEPRTQELRLFGKLIEETHHMGFPKFSNDSQYLEILHTGDIISHLGSRDDDHRNFFTVRMLLLLESTCLFGEAKYDQITRDIISSYFKDYPDHENTFRPVFLMNDICRFWKTLLLNYENKRDVSDEPEEKTKQKVKNFKLKFSRMTTCFATIAALGSYLAPVNEEHVFEQTQLTPRDRLINVTTRVPEAEDAVQDILHRYAWFLGMTGLPTDQLRAHFTDKEQRTEMFKLANEYGDSMFNLLIVLDKANGGNTSLLRYVVI